MPDRLRDGALLLSLKGFLHEEQGRIEAEAAQRRMVLEEVRKAQEELSARSEAERKSSAERKLGLLERARLEHEARARVEVVERQQEHERRLEAMREQASRGSQRQLTTLSLLFAGAILATALGIYVGKLRPDAQRLQIAYDELVAAERERSKETERLLERAERRRSDTEDELERTKRRLEAAERELAALKKQRR